MASGDPGCRGLRGQRRVPTDAETERSGTFEERGFRAAKWKYASYFLVVLHEGVRPHGKRWKEEEVLEERGWTSPIFFRRGDSMDGDAGEAG